MRSHSGLSRIVSFGISMGLLALASLLAIPAMLHASGSATYGAIATGQGIGAIGATVLLWGWGMSGPAMVADASPSVQRGEFRTSLRARWSLAAPVATVVVAVTFLIGAPHALALPAIVGGLSALAVGLTHEWFFIGVSRPWMLLVWETIPRVVGTCLGIVLMLVGHSALWGVACQGLGMLTAGLVSPIWIERHLGRHGAGPTRPEALLPALMARRHGLTAAVALVAFWSLPLTVVLWCNPGVQSQFAIADKLQKQVTVGVQPVVNVIQGWVPRGDVAARSRKAALVGVILAVVASIGGLVVLWPLSEWIGGGKVHLPWYALIAMSLFVGLALLDGIFGRAILASYQRLDRVVRAVMIGGAVTLVGAAVGSVLWGAAGALYGMLVGLLVQIGLQYWFWRQASAPLPTVGADDFDSGTAAGSGVVAEVLTGN